MISKWCRLEGLNGKMTERRALVCQFVDCETVSVRWPFGNETSQTWPKPIDFTVRTLVFDLPDSQVVFTVATPESAVR